MSVFRTTLYTFAGLHIRYINCRNGLDRTDLIHCVCFDESVTAAG